jgi:hypothetical protein
MVCVSTCANTEHIINLSFVARDYCQPALDIDVLDVFVVSTVANQEPITQIVRIVDVIAYHIYIHI